MAGGGRRRGRGFGQQATEFTIIQNPSSASNDTATIDRRPARLPKARIWLARCAILWERLLLSVWPALFVVGLFLVAVLFDLLPLLPGWVHLGALVAFAAGLAYGLGHIWPALHFPRFGEGIRRIERTSGLAHRPLTALADSLATSSTDPAAAALWEAYRRRLGRAVAGLRIGWPNSGLVEKDPIALRALIGLLLVVGLIGAWNDVPDRLRRAFSPSLSGIGVGLPLTISVSITPPVYTGKPPIFLEINQAIAPATAAPTTIEVPIGSIVLAQVQGADGAPSLGIGERAIAFDAIEPGTYQTKAEITAGDRLAIVADGREAAGWPMTVLPDNAPTIDFASPPAAGERRALRLAYLAGDDYGVVAVTGTVRRPDGVTGPGRIQQIDLQLAVPALDPKKAHQVSYHDLTPHPWAGLPVVIQLTARDALGQTALTEAVEFVLPERQFNNPVAQAIIEQRRVLINGPNNNSIRMRVARDLYAIAAQPPAYNDDLVAVLGLRVAQQRLIQDDSDAGVDSVVGLLWDLALRIEEGELAMAERELRAIQQALQEALAGDASDEEIQRLMDQLQQAMDKFLTALQEKMMREQTRPHHARQFDPNVIEARREDIQRMLERARELAKGGAREAARDMLAQLQELLENLQTQPMDGMDEATSEAMQMLEDMERLTEEQKRLLDESFRRSQQQGDGEPIPDGAQSAARQEALRRALGDVMRRYGEMMGDIPRSLGRAERSMKDATEALRGGQPGEAVQPQGRALGELQQGLQDMASAMMDRLRQQAGRQPGDDEAGQGGDPLGRNENGLGMMDTSDVQIPDQSDVQRARELIEELRRRSGDRSRPKFERDYIDRLLRQF